MTDPFIHHLSDVQSSAIGHGTRIWQFVVVLPGAVIGEDCNICSHCFIENDVRVGDRVTIKSGVQVWDGVHLEDDVFVGPNVSFSNDSFPRSRAHPETFKQTRIGSGASIGSGAVLLPGVTVGKAAMVGAGAVVTKNVPPFAIVVGNPARIVGYQGVSKGQRASVAPAQFPHQEGRQETAVAGVSLVRLARAIDIRGSLTAGEFEKSVPFAVKRYFLVFDVPSAETRGQHAHRECHQFLVCVHGSVSVVADDGQQRQEFQLDRPDIGVHLPPRTWGIQYNYSSDAVLLVFASHYYDPEDYIRDYDEFLKFIGTEG